MSAERDTVVLPLAGAGARLGLPTPKELLPLGEGRVALDATLDLLAPHTARLRLVAVIGENREATVRYLRRRCTDLGLPLAFAFQAPSLPESTGAVIGAEPWFGPATLVLLADQVLHTPAPQAVGDILDIIHDGHRAAFLAAREASRQRLATDGALLLDDAHDCPRIVDFADKPGLEEAGRFNAVWFGYAFAHRAAQPFLQALHRSTLRLPILPDQLTPLLGAHVVEVGPFSDLGTWPAVTAHWKEGCP
jgi:UTP-glucose-1-phosphate uridylyltransferase